jgi:hypothetical protein
MTETSGQLIYLLIANFMIVVLQVNSKNLFRNDEKKLTCFEKFPPKTGAML